MWHGGRIAHQQTLKLFRKHLTMTLFGRGPEVAKLLLELVPLPKKDLIGELCRLHHRLPSRSCCSRAEELLSLPWSERQTASVR